MIAPSVVSSKIISERTWVWAFTAEGSVNKNLRRSVWEDCGRSQAQNDSHRGTLMNVLKCTLAQNHPSHITSIAVTLRKKEEERVIWLTIPDHSPSLRGSQAASHITARAESGEMKAYVLLAGCLYTARFLHSFRVQPQPRPWHCPHKGGSFPLNKQDSPAQAHPQAYCSKQSLTEVLQWGTSGLCQGDSYN